MQFDNRDFNQIFDFPSCSYFEEPTVSNKIEFHTKTSLMNLFSDSSDRNITQIAQVPDLEQKEKNRNDLELNLDYCILCQSNTCKCHLGLPVQSTFERDEKLYFDEDLSHRLSVEDDSMKVENHNSTCYDHSRFENTWTNDYAKLKIPKPNFEQNLQEKESSDGKNNPEINVSSINTKNQDSMSNSLNSSEEVKIEDDLYEPLSSKNKKSRGKNDSNLFLIRRACFRGFSKYFNNLFSRANYSWQRQRGNKKKKTPILVLVREFAENEFGDVVKRLNEEQWLRFRKSLLTVLFSHRYKKSDEFLKECDFTIIRNVLYHYTTEARNEFLKDAHFWYLLHHFYKRNRKEFLQLKEKEKCKLDLGELKQELAILDEEALIELAKSHPIF